MHACGWSVASEHWAPGGHGSHGYVVEVALEKRPAYNILSAVLEKLRNRATSPQVQNTTANLALRARKFALLVGVSARATRFACYI